MKNIKLKSLVLSILLGIIIFVSIQYVNAQIETLREVKQGECITLIQQCGTCTYNNITSVRINQNTTEVLGLTAMVQSGTEYTYNFCGTTNLGWHRVNGVGDLDGETVPWNYEFEVTPTGRDIGSIFNNPIILILFGLGLILLVVGTLQGNPWFGFIGSIMFLILGVYTMIYGFDNYTDMYTRSVAIVFLGVGIVTMFSSAYEFIETGGSNDEE